MGEDFHQLKFPVRRTIGEDGEGLFHESLLKQGGGGEKGGEERG